MTREEICNSMTLQDAIQVFRDTNAYGTMDIAKSVILEALEQQQKTGHWIGHKGVTVYPNSEGNLTEFIACKCSECGEWLTGSDEYVCSGRFCPSCGIKMEAKE